MDKPDCCGDVGVEDGVPQCNGCGVEVVDACDPGADDDSGEVRVIDEDLPGRDIHASAIGEIETDEVSVPVCEAGWEGVAIDHDDGGCVIKKPLRDGESDSGSSLRPRARRWVGPSRCVLSRRRPFKGRASCVEFCDDRVRFEVPV